MNSMNEVLAAKPFPKTSAAAPTKKAALDVHVHVKAAPDPEATKRERQYLVEDEKRLAKQRKMTRDILNQWDPTAISARARESLSGELKTVEAELRRVRKQLGK